ncbi:MAG: GDP-mannose 4,6-dehydratase [Anaerolineae bacterium]|nr:GDP-mannose 4,6-dehydratase [Anaerolineae bacterium]
MKILVTGAGGFVGGHLLTYLNNQSKGELYGTLGQDVERRPALVALCPNLWTLDLRDPAPIRDILAAVRPDQIFHLAGQAYVPRSFEDPWDTLETNIRGTLNVLQAVRDLALPARVLVVGSAEVYGAVKPEYLPLNEDSPLAPTSPYSVSKVGQDMLALQYTLAHQVFTVRTRPFNHIGPGQNNRFAVPNWASQIAEAEVGRRDPVVYVGNLSAARDFTDVRDVVRAYAMALDNGKSGEVYNVCSGQAYTMQSIMDRLVSLSRIPIEVRIDPERFRAVEIPVLKGSFRRLHEQTGWEPQIPIDQSLRDVLDEWRQHVDTPVTK